MNAFVAVTDKDWFTHLQAAGDLDEVNFWQPSAAEHFKRLIQVPLSYSSCTARMISSSAEASSLIGLSYGRALSGRRLASRMEQARLRRCGIALSVTAVFAPVLGRTTRLAAFFCSNPSSLLARNGFPFQSGAPTLCAARAMIWPLSQDGNCGAKFSSDFAPERDLWQKKR